MGLVSRTVAAVRLLFVRVVKILRISDSEACVKEEKSGDVVEEG